jgi:hypothetical protein
MAFRITRIAPATDKSSGSLPRRTIRWTASIDSSHSPSTAQANSQRAWAGASLRILRWPRVCLNER